MAVIPDRFSLKGMSRPNIPLRIEAHTESPLSSEASDMVTDFRIGHRLPNSGHRLSNWSETFGFGDRTPSELVTDFAMW